MNYVPVLLFLSASVIIVFGCNPPLVNHTDFIIPEEFELIESDSTVDEILSVKYGNEMQIRVLNTMSKAINNSMFFGSALMKQTFESKFPQLVARMKGFNESGQGHYYIGKNTFLHRSFDYRVGETIAYFEYGAMHVEEPESYYEFYITGKKDLRGDKHNLLIKAFLDGVR